MRIIDTYIIKKFLGTFFFAIALIIVIVIVFDISERVDDFVKNNAPLNEIIIDYYLNFIPYFINLFSPLFTFIAVIFFTSKMASNTEIVAILSNGISFRRMLLPYLISATILAAISFYLANFLIPLANKTRLDFEYRYFHTQDKYSDRNIHIQISPGTFAYIESYNFETNTGYKFVLESMYNDGSYSKLASNMIRWDTTKNIWSLEKYNIRYVKDMNEKTISGEKLDTVINMLPSDMKRDVRNMEVMNFSQLRRFIKDEKQKGSEDVVFYDVEKHKRMANPFATIILTFIGVALSSRKVRGGIGMHLGLGLTISFAYILFMQVSTTFATYGNLNPLISVWIPNILFGLLGVLLIKTAPK
ncbi:MAG: putative permease YjgP/YjgQ family protein [Bacteroidetes bacterium ADurb.Bin408]|nr:MAG: putative permease YjgP/YjgQ family protein [Bacteroidetes bacterium ADurb.Bin408]